MTNFSYANERIDASTMKMHVDWNGAPVAMIDAFKLLAEDAAFRDGLVASLRAAPFEGYFWETPPVTERTSGRHFEFV